MNEKFNKETSIIYQAFPVNYITTLEITNSYSKKYLQCKYDKNRWGKKLLTSKTAIINKQLTTLST